MGFNRGKKTTKKNRREGWTSLSQQRGSQDFHEDSSLSKEGGGYKGGHLLKLKAEWGIKKRTWTSEKSQTKSPAKEGKGNDKHLGEKL